MKFKNKISLMQSIPEATPMETTKLFFQLEIYISDNVLYHSELVACDTEDDFNKYSAYCEQSIRELYGSTKVKSKRYRQEVHIINSESINSMERNLMNISEVNGKLMELKRNISLMFPTRYSKKEME